MFKRLRYFIVLCFTLLTVTSAKADILDKFHFERFITVTHVSSSGMNLWVEIRSDWAHTLIIKKGKVDVKIHGNHVATIELRDKIKIPPRSTTKVLIPLRFSANNTLSLQRILRHLIQDGGLNTTIDYRVRAGIKVLKINFSDKNVAVSEILNNFALSNESLQELVNMI